MPDYAVRFTRRYDGLIVASFPDLPEAIAYGRDDEEALQEAARTLEIVLRRRILSGEEIPEPRASGPLLISQGVLAAALA